jgi:hypothetical protein
MDCDDVGLTVCRARPTFRRRERLWGYERLANNADVPRRAPRPSDVVSVSNAADNRPILHSLLLLSGAFSAVQALLSDYGDGNSAAAGFWFAVDCLLLVVVYRKRSRVARGVIIVTALVGAVIYGLASLENEHAAVLALAYLGQAVPLLTGPVRQHVAPRA